MTAGGVSVQVCTDAWSTAQAAAELSALSVRVIDEPDRHRDVEALFTRIWRTAGTPSPISGDMMRMLSYTGAYVAGAYSAEQLVGAAVGFLTAADDGQEPHLHSHIAGVAPEQRGRQIGFALKLHQRAWALERGFDRISWTFDPLVRRNAHFNLTKLGARVTRYLVDFYGDMSDGLNAGHGSDRLLVEWLLESESVIAAAQGCSPDGFPRPVAAARPLLSCDDHGEPRPGVTRAIGWSSCALPPDIEAVRATDPGCARRWRAAVRSVLAPVLESGARIVGFDREQGYLLINDVPSSP